MLTLEPQHHIFDQWIKLIQNTPAGWTGGFGEQSRPALPVVDPPPFPHSVEVQLERFSQVG
jgi:hypothetical protein